jgi:hypothetical protein
MHNLKINNSIYQAWCRAQQSRRPLCNTESEYTEEGIQTIAGILKGKKKGVRKKKSWGDKKRPKCIFVLFPILLTFFTMFKIF